MTALRAIYRLQLAGDFGFAAARELVPYLADLGVSHLYLPPSFQARPGSTHGYDVVDPGPSLERGRQVQVRHAEVGEVGHELARGGEPEIPGELQAVGGPQRGHAIRLRTVMERAVTLSSPRAA